MASYSKTYSGDLTTYIVGKIFNAANMAKEEKAKQEEDRKKGIDVEDKGNLHLHALRSEFGGDLYSRTIGTFDSSRSHEQTDRQSSKAARFSANFYRQKREAEEDIDTETKKSSDLLDDAVKELSREDKESIPVKDSGLRSYVSKVFGVGIDARLIALENKANQSLAAVRDIRTLNEGNMNLMLDYNELFASKLDVILSLYKEQFSYQKKIEDDLESKGVSDELSKGEILSKSQKYVKSKTSDKSSIISSPLSRYFLRRGARKAAAAALKNLPKSKRNRILSAKKVPAKITGSLKNKLPPNVKNAADKLSAIKNLRGLSRSAGPARYVFAGMEYSERKGAGQSDLQAISGVGSGLAGAAGGGAAGAKGGAVIGAIVGGPPGAVIGAIIGGITGSIIGGMAGSRVSDKVTGVYETGTGFTERGTAMLHGTEMYESIDTKTGIPRWAINNIGSALVSSSIKMAAETGVKSQIQNEVSKLPFEVRNIPQTLSISSRKPPIAKKSETLFSSLLMNPGDFFKSKNQSDAADDEDNENQPPPAPENELQIIPGNGVVRGGAVVTQRNDRDNEQTGSDIALKDSMGNYSTGAIIQNPFSSLKIKKVGFQGSGSGPTGNGFGLYVVGSMIVDDKEYEILLGHLNKAHVKEGDILGPGDSIGEQGISGRATGPHVSTHVNSMEKDVTAAQRVLSAVERAWTSGSVIQSKSYGQTTLQAFAATPTQAEAFYKIKSIAADAGSPNPDVTAAIAMLETGWLANPNSVYFASGKTNPFGQSGRHPVTGKYVVAKDGVESIVYGSLKEGVEDHVKKWKDSYIGNNAKEMIENIRRGITSSGKSRGAYNSANPNWGNDVYRIYLTGTRNPPGPKPSRTSAGPTKKHQGPVIPGSGGGDRGSESGSKIKKSSYGSSLPFRSPIPEYPNYERSTDQYGAFFAKIYKIADAAGDPFPEIVAAQAVEESNFGKSNLAKEANNLFGQDAPAGASESEKYRYFDPIEQRDHDAYRFRSFEESVRYRVRIWKKFYGSAKTPAEAIRNIAAAGYNPHAIYPSKIIQLLRNYGVEPDKPRPIAPKVGPKKVGSGIPFIPELTIKKAFEKLFDRRPAKTSSSGYEARSNQLATNLQSNSQILDDLESQDVMIQFVVLNNTVVEQPENTITNTKSTNPGLNRTNLKMQILAS
jgi:hypothetical protein